MKQATVQICDARRKGEVKRGGFIVIGNLPAYRVKSVASNGEPLAHSEVLNDVKAVKTHINAMVGLWNPKRNHSPFITDHTKSQVFVAKGIAGKSGLKK